MENASKALIMAGTVLISLMVISIGVYIVNMFGEYTSKQEKEREMQQIAEFNAQFLKYEGRTDITAQDIVSVANLAKENNELYEFAQNQTVNENIYYIQVDIDNIKTNFEKENNKEEFLLKEYSTKTPNPNPKNEVEIKYYKCGNNGVEVSPVTKRVYKITFTE